MRISVKQDCENVVRFSNFQLESPRRRRSTRRPIVPVRPPGGGRPVAPDRPPGGGRPEDPDRQPGGGNVNEVDISNSVNINNEELDEIEDEDEVFQYFYKVFCANLINFVFSWKLQDGLGGL